MQKITIIISVLNGAETLEKCLISIFQQTYANVELIIIDGGSCDGTVNILKKYSDKISYYISEPDSGIYNAWNKGLARASGEWICFLGADDFFWTAQVLEQMAVQLVRIPPDIRVAYGQIMLLNKEGGIIYPIGDPWEKVKDRFKQVMCLPHPGAMHRHSLFEQHGNFDESFRIAGDYELLLRELKTKDAFYIPDLVVVAMMQGGVSSNPANSLLSMKESRRAQQMHGLRAPGLIWLTATARVYVRLLLWWLLGEGLAKKALDLCRRRMGLPRYWTKI